MGLTSCMHTPRAPKTGLPEGLILHLDASQGKSLEVRDGTVVLWRDLSGQGNDARLVAGPGPESAAEGLNGLPILRFDGETWLEVEELAGGPGGITAFAVFRRTEEQASKRKWQRLLSCWDGKTDNDTKGPSFFVDTGTKGAAQVVRIRQCLSAGNTHRGRLRIGANMTKPGEELIGDVAEILVFNHSFLVHEQIQSVKDYLFAKWGFEEDRSDWTRTGPLPELPEHRTTKRPLSDQENRGRWRRFESLWDDFKGDELDDAKWWDHNPFWYGRAPSRFLPGNVAVRDGMLHLTFQRDDALPREVLYKGNGAEYHTYSSAAVQAKTDVRYGYFEIKARPMDSAASSAFWFSGGAKDMQGGQYGNEIDVFEIGGKAVKYEHRYGMNAHVFQTPEDGKKHWNSGGTWVAPFRLADDFHVYGLEWTPKVLNYYVDGILVRTLKNTHWHTPLALDFDSEAMFSWLGVPKDEDLPSTFSIEYVRAWKNDETDADWREDYLPRHDRTKPTRITKYAREFRTHHPK